MYEGVEKGENNFEKIMLVNLRLKNVTLKVEWRNVWLKEMIWNGDVFGLGK